MVNKNKIIFYILLFYTFYTFSQKTIKGTINDAFKNKIEFVNIVLKDSKNSIITYTFSDKEGSYSLDLKKNGNYIVQFSALSFETKTIKIAINKDTIIKNIILNNKSLQLEEVIVQSTKDITIKKDTIVFNVKAFAKGNEQVVEDLLKNIPGISIDEIGNIKIGNKLIEKVMIDGDDFFEKGYKILTKNMPPEPIEKVEVLRNYSNNKLLKGIEESDKVALNLVLKEKFKRIWFGNTELGYDVSLNNKFSLQGNLMNFGKKNKIYFLTNLNNIGYNATGDIDHLIKNSNYAESQIMGDNQNANKLLNLGSFTPNFKAKRTNINDDKLASLNTILNITKKIKLKAITFFNSDKTNFFRNSIETFDANDLNFINSEDFKLKTKKNVDFLKLNLSYDISKTKNLDFVTKYNSQKDYSNSNLIFNTQNTKQNLKSTNKLFDQKITYTNQFKKNKVLIFTGRFINEKAPQEYTINQNFYQELFPNITNANNVLQKSENKMNFAGFEIQLLDRKQNKNLLDIQFGNQFRQDKYTSSFTLKENNLIINNPIGYQNKTEYITNDLYLKTKYRVQLKKIALETKLDFHQLFNTLKQINVKKEHPFFINPNISLEWNINDKNKIFSSLSYNKTNAKILDVFSNYVLAGFGSFVKGNNDFNQLDATTYSLNYTLGNWSDKFFANAHFIYNKNHDFYSSNSIISQNFSQSEKIIIKNRELLSSYFDINRFIKLISSNIKFNIGYTKINLKSVVNNSELTEIINNNYNYGFELRSGFKGSFNYHFGTKWSTNKIQSFINNSFTNNTTFLDLLFNFNPKFNLQFQNERYKFGSVDKKNNTYYFSDIEANYVIKKNKLNLTLSAKNLFNTETYKTFSITDISTSLTEYKLLSRYILLKAEYRF